jgi:hypothetical protein
MNTVIVFSETDDAENWAKSWRRGEGNRHEMFEKLGIKCRTFRDANDFTSTSVLFDIPDMTAFEMLLETDEIKQAMAEDKLKLETFRMLTEFTP